MQTNRLFPLSLLALAALVHAQEAVQTQLPAVTITGRNLNAPVNVGGFGDTPNARLPLQALRVDAERLSELGATGLSALPRLDASVSDGYNSLGYIPQLSVRGFELDTRFNLRRDGLPLNGQTAFDLSNKAAAELLKGASGLQAGTSAPSGLLNLVVKRPETAPRLDLSLGWESANTWTASVDAGTRTAAGLGLRVNASATRLSPWLRNTEGERQAAAFATDWRMGPQDLLELEGEWSRQSQPSQPGFSLLGNRLPSAGEIDRRRNLGDTPWQLPVDFDNRIASLRWTHTLSPDWRLVVHGGQQRAVNDDRVPFPFGCYDAATDIYYADRYCPNGSFDLYDFRSEDERRTSTALRATFEGKLQWGGLTHQLRVAALDHRLRADFQRQAYNVAGTGSLFSPSVSTPDPALTDENTNRREHTREISISDQVQWGDWELFAGLRHTRLQRAAVRTDGSRPTDYPQSFTTPWLGLTWALAQDLRVYLSTGEGVESEVTPNRSRYVNAGQAFTLKSRQTEVGLKSGSQTVDWSLAAFDIRRPAWRDIGACGAAGTCVRRIDGEAQHRGLEAQADLKWRGGGLLASAQWLNARRQGSSDPAANGLRPVNVPQDSQRLTLRQQITAKLQAQASVVREGRRAALPDNSLWLPAWTRLDLSARIVTQWQGQSWTAALGIDNLTDAKAWKESPNSFGHVYLFPLAPRSFSAKISVAL